ncbi:hypothetical protein FV226_25335 [Methylobacterium sp. WL12]|uniref:hypothetical protein n=1 Tax=Methylobacterium sp. WL12 TaxID=2603890 RepID=UPI0011CB09AD|nr:hypothetical protein [Methylobacterium sp. WL12]TXM65242.1 hypothetical protein FV226_25335 [Methylobacterium sp. WL12]
MAAFWAAHRCANTNARNYMARSQHRGAPEDPTVTFDPVPPLHATISDLVSSSFKAGTEPDCHAWIAFWSDVAEQAATFSLESTPLEIDDLLDRMWARLTIGERPFLEHRALHRKLLIVAGARADNELESLLMMYGDYLHPPRLRDWTTTLAIFSQIVILRGALNDREKAAARDAMATYFHLLNPNRGVH